MFKRNTLSPKCVLYDNREGHKMLATKLSANKITQYADAIATFIEITLNHEPVLLWLKDTHWFHIG